MMRLLPFLVTVLALSISCTKNVNRAGGKIGLYLLKSYQTPAGKCQVDPSSAVLEDTPTIQDDEFLAYSKKDYQFF